MKKTAFDLAVAEAKAFLEVASQFSTKDFAERRKLIELYKGKGYPSNASDSYFPAAGPVLTGALKRKSLDLTRALAQMRKP